VLVILETIIVSLAGGAIFYLLKFPLPWMFGAAIACLAWRHLLKRRVGFPLSLRDAGLVIFGYMLGISFTAEAAREVAVNFPGMVFATMFLFLCSVGLAFISRRFLGIKLRTALLAHAPGAFSQMVSLGDDIPGVEALPVAAMQSVRLLATAFLVPFIVVHFMVAGSVDTNLVTAGLDFSWENYKFLPLYFLAVGAVIWLFVRMRFPSAHLSGAIFGAAVLSCLGLSGPDMPGPLTMLAQMSIGVYLAQILDVKNVNNWPKLLTAAVLGNCLLIGATLAGGWVLTRFYPITLVDAFLAAAPGGMAEMGITAIMVEAKVSLVASYQLFRVLFVIFAVIPFYKWLFGRKIFRAER